MGCDVVSVHDRLVVRAGEAIGAVCADVTASPEETLRSLEALRDKLDVLIEAVGEDVKRWREPWSGVVRRTISILPSSS